MIVCMISRLLGIGVSIFFFLGGRLAPSLFAHDIGNHSHGDSDAHYDFSVHPPGAIVAKENRAVQRPMLMAALGGGQSKSDSIAKPSAGSVEASFLAFAPKVKTHLDDNFLYVESDGMPAHNMMIGITAWQQQVPLPQPYT